MSFLVDWKSLKFERGHTQRWSESKCSSTLVSRKPAIRSFVSLISTCWLFYRAQVRTYDWEIIVRMGVSCIIHNTMRCEIIFMIQKNIVHEETTLKNPKCYSCMNTNSDEHWRTNLTCDSWECGSPTLYLRPMHHGDTPLLKPTQWRFTSNDELTLHYQYYYTILLVFPLFRLLCWFYVCM